jgi:hypothetical protein
MVAAATRIAQAAFWLADDSRYGSTPPRAAGGIVLRVFILGPAGSWPRFLAVLGKNKELGRSLEIHFEPWAAVLARMDE